MWINFKTRVFKFSSRDNSSNKLRKIKDAISNLVEISTIQGLPQILKTKRLGFRLFWILCLATASAVCSYYIFNCLAKYFSRNYYTVIKRFNDDSPFPAISICSYDETDFNVSFLTVLFESEILTDYWKEHFEVYHDQMYGKCFRFNSGKNFYINSA